MSQQYNQLPQTSTSKPSLDDDLLESLQNIPSNFDLALNGGTTRTNTFLTPNPPKSGDPGLLDPDAFRRLSISTISSMGQSRGVSPYPRPTGTEPRTWKNSFQRFWCRYQGLLLVAISQLFGALMNVTTRLLELEGEGMHPFQVLFVRMSFTLVFCCAWMWYANVPDFPLGAKGIRWLLVARGLTGFFGIYGMYYSLQYLPVADAVVITFLAPSVASYACYLFLHEPFPRSAQYASLISLLGVVLIARPTSFFSSPSPPSTPIGSSNNTTNPLSTGSSADDGFPTPTSAQRLSAVAIAMLGVLGSAGAFTSIRWIGNRAHPLISVNYFATWCTFVSTLVLSVSRPLHLSTLSFALPNGVRQWSMLIFLGICGFVTQFLLTKGLAAGGRKGGAAATNMIYTNMLFALSLDKLVFGQSPGWWSLGGSGLILGSAVFVAVRKEGEGDEGGRRTGVLVDEEGAGGDEEEEMGMLRAQEGEADYQSELESEAGTESVGLRDLSR